ncbi:hypothetical protein APSETT444_008618 [Aspergillus pseudonomiae]
MTELIPSWQQPSHPDRAFFAKITTATPGDHDTYSSVATGIDSRIELNSDLVYCNHSCAPSLVFDMTRFEVRVADDRPLAVGDELTFFYPSTEWTMVQPFQCRCGAGLGKCLGRIAGASQIHSSVPKEYWLNIHIRQQLDVLPACEVKAAIPPRTVEVKESLGIGLSEIP